MKHRQPRQSKTRNDSAIERGVLWFEDVRQCGMDDEAFYEMLEDKHLTAIRVVSLAHDWNQRVWLSSGDMLHEDINLEMTLRKERRGQLDHWYAYRRVFGKLHKRYVGHSEQITESRLVEIARRLPSV